MERAFNLPAHVRRNRQLEQRRRFLAEQASKEQQPIKPQDSPSDFVPEFALESAKTSNPNTPGGAMSYMQSLPSFDAPKALPFGPGSSLPTLPPRRPLPLTYTESRQKTASVQNVVELLEQVRQQVEKLQSDKPSPTKAEKKEPHSPGTGEAMTVFTASGQSSPSSSSSSSSVGSSPAPSACSAASAVVPVPSSVSVDELQRKLEAADRALQAQTQLCNTLKEEQFAMRAQIKELRSNMDDVFLKIPKQQPAFYAVALQAMPRFSMARDRELDEGVEKDEVARLVYPIVKDDDQNAWVTHRRIYKNGTIEESVVMFYDGAKKQLLWEDLKF